MVDELYGLQVRFMESGTHFMVLERSNGMRREELDSLQLNMLLANTPPNLIPLRLQEINENTMLLYNISSLKMLSYSLRGSTLTIQDALDLLTGIVQALDQAANYMLHVDRFVLHEQFIFIGKGWRDVSLLYIPMQLSQAPLLRVQMKQLLGVIMQHLTKAHMNPLAELERQYDQQNWSVSLFREQLQQLALNPNRAYNMQETEEQQLRNEPYQERTSLLGGGFSNRVQPQVTNVAQAPSTMTDTSEPPQASSKGWIFRLFGKKNKEATPKIKKEKPAKVKKEKSPKEQKESPAWGLREPGSKQAERHSNQETNEQEVTVASSSKNLIVIGLVASLLGCAYAWSQYMTLMTEGWLYIALGLTLVLVAFLLVYLPRGVKDWSGTKPKKLKTKFKLEDEGTEYEVEVPELAASVVKPKPANQSGGQVGQQFPVHANNHLSSASHQQLEPSSPPPYQQGNQQVSQQANQVMSQPVNQPQYEVSAPVLSAPNPTDNTQSDYYANLPQHTVMLPQGDAQATVFLGKDALAHMDVIKATKSTEPRPYLETNRKGSSIQFTLHIFPFVIGRGNEAHVKTETTIGVSRMHVEITQKFDKYFIRDLGSKNGTSLNQTQLVAYENYPLNEGDQIGVLTETYIFKKVTL
ncbi:FHA domain-containing protein [Paenibacillus sp. N1-5-1-14]|uniref:FHA domain-containing protein n=1 Tax=Paenibacillus radicibacter TaxID=2972488 RepID=UPI0021599DB6|nr:FHA domain-containing protein [Paenibacillus radicibacter]MCR8641358.1 FHA domain-containing protein [Paenibacillus radicibacter]